jgi:hypothetical protein
MEATTLLLAIGLGGVVGLSLALTGSGGTAFAVPLLVYVLKLSPHRAVCVSMAAIGATTVLATVQKLRAKGIDVRAGLVLAMAGMFGAPAGAWIGRFVPENWLLVMFASMVSLVGIRMLLPSSAKTNESRAIAESAPHTETRVKSARSFALPSTRTLGLCAAGLVTGLLAGLLGVGGGFILVPVLVLFGGVEIHRAVATSLCVIALVSVPATASHLLAGQTIPLDLTALFAIGAILGLKLGSRLAAKLSGPRLQQLFGATMLVMATLILLHNLKPG